MNTNINTKEGIRKQIRRWRNELTPDWITERSRSIVDKCVALEEFKNAETICLYIAITGEARLDAMIEECWQQGKRVLVPAYRKESDDYGFKSVKEDTKMIQGLWDVPEPDVSEWSTVGSGDICIAVPGVAFDNSGVRVGHGKGYYDRLLAFTKKRTNCTKVGIGFDFQRFSTLPCEEWDIGMDIVLSESHITHKT